ncbi:MAG: hypothetical protein WDN09_03535 [bacterium]
MKSFMSIFSVLLVALFLSAPIAGRAAETPAQTKAQVISSLPTMEMDAVVPVDAADGTGASSVPLTLLLASTALLGILFICINIQKAKKKRGAAKPKNIYKK